MANESKTDYELLGAWLRGEIKVSDEELIRLLRAELERRQRVEA